MSPPEVPIPSRYSSPDTAARFRRYYYLLLSKLWLILLVVAATMGGTWAWLQRQPSVYSSTGTILVEESEPRVVNMEKVENDRPESAEFVLTAVQMLGTKELMLRVAKSLTTNKDFEAGSHGADGAPLSVEEIANMIGKEVNAKLRRPTRLIDVTVEDTDPKRARIIAEAVTTEFLKQSYEHNANLSRAANEFLFQEAARLKEKLEKSEEKLQKYREENWAVSLEDRQNIIVDKLKELNSQAAQAKESRLRLESDLEQIKRIDPSSTEELMHIESVARLPQVSEIRFRIVRGESELAVLKQRYSLSIPNTAKRSAKLAISSSPSPLLWQKRVTASKRVTKLRWRPNRSWTPLLRSRRKSPWISIRCPFPTTSSRGKSHPTSRHTTP